MLSLLYCLGLCNGGTELRNVCVCLCERERDRVCVFVSVLCCWCVSACVWGGWRCVWKTQLFVSMFMHLWAWIYTCLSDRQPQSTFVSECIICLLCDSTHKWAKMSHGEIQSVIHRLSCVCANRGQHLLINWRQAAQVQRELWRKDASLFQPVSQSAGHISEASGPVDAPGRMCC